MPVERSETEVFRSPELATLMGRVQELLEARVLCMVLIDHRGKASVSCPPGDRELVLEVLRTTTWANVH